jgi:methylmalonyl-CoA/ethylmalonyl-CoA epimerase
MDNIKRVDHVAIVVEDIEAALGFWRDGLGLEVTHVEDVPDQDSVVAFLPTGDSEVELVKPTSPDSGVARFLGRRGPGIHHICFEVADLEANLQRLQERGIRLINTQPVIGTAGKKIAFIHPESTHGVLVELYEMTGQEPEIRLARARTLSDRVVGESQVMVAGVLGFLRALRDGGPNPVTNAARSSRVGAPRNGTPFGPNDNSM